MFCKIRAIHMFLCHLRDVNMKSFIKFYTKNIVALGQHPFLYSGVYTHNQFY